MIAFPVFRLSYSLSFGCPVVYGMFRSKSKSNKGKMLNQRSTIPTVPPASRKLRLYTLEGILVSFSFEIKNTN